MTVFSQFARWFGRRRLTPTRRARPRPTLEALETRNLLSTLTVTSLLDTGVKGDGSLRGEIAAAKSGDLIDFAPGLAGHTIKLKAANGPLVLRKNVTIDGLGAGRLTISGNDATRVFDIAAGADDIIANLTIARGNADGILDGGGGVFVRFGATLKLDHCTLSGNHADQNASPDGVSGGGLLNEGTVTVTNCTFSGNHADGDTFGGGGLYDAAARATVRNSTFSGNTADGDAFGGGGVFISSNAMLTLDHCTVSGNRADHDTNASSGGIFNFGALTLDFSNVNGNFAPKGADLHNLGGIVTLHHSKVGVRADG
jgi:hypothetical protein